MTRSAPSAPSTGTAWGCVVDVVRCEHHDVALGIGEARPRLSWKIDTADEDWTQLAYELQVASDAGVVESSGRIDSAESVLVPWPAAALGSRTRRTIRVRVWGSTDEHPTEWSAPAIVETGLLEAADWTAQLISPDRASDDTPDQPPTLFRRNFQARSDIDSARLYLTAHGVVQAEINGERVGQDVLTPGWTSYHHRLRYSTYDVTTLISAGRNALGATVADGWFRGLVGFDGGRRNVYGSELALLAQLEIRYLDGTTEIVATDDEWRAGTGPIRAAGIYDGESYDARDELAGWSEAGFVDDAWDGVRTREPDHQILVAPPGPPVRRIEEIAPVGIFTSPSGATIVDFGQNLVGRLRIRVDGPAGSEITLRHAEVLENGELAIRPLRVAKATDHYVLRGGGVEEWEPQFTFHGFRYAEISGWPGPLSAADVRAVVLHTDMRRTGWFSCSDDLITQLHENVVWGMRGNFLDLPTDCPQRDERLGWTGDIQIFAPTARFLYDCTGMLDSWLADLAAEQTALGTVPVYVPYIQLLFPVAPVAAWGDAAVVVPWVLYQRAGDLDLLRRQYPSMKAWVDQVTELAGPGLLWDTGMQLGDWLDPAAPPDRPEAARTDPRLVAAAYHARSTEILARAAGALGIEADRTGYAELAAGIRTAFADEYVTPNGRLASDAPTAFALALHFGLLAPDQRDRAARRLIELIKAGDHRIATGFVGTPIICDTLDEIGANDTAYHLLTQRECPSWLYPVTMGATTIWERWDSMLPDGTINPGEMTSFNHYALGAVADWLHRSVAGLAPAGPGYRQLLIAPRPGGGLTHAGAAHETPYGRAEVSWQRIGDRLEVAVRVPPGTSATIRLPEPGSPVHQVGSGRYAFGCRFRPVEDDPPIPTWSRLPERATDD